MIVLRADWPLATLGRAAPSVWKRVTRGRRPVTGLDTRLLAARDTIRAVLGRNWRQAVLLTAGRLGFDYGCLQAGQPPAAPRRARPTPLHSPHWAGAGAELPYVPAG